MHIYSVISVTSTRVTVYDFCLSCMYNLIPTCLLELAMDPRRFAAPIQCVLCDLLLYTLQDVSQHGSYHETISFICHHCLTNFDNMGAPTGHMNQKGGHLRKPLDFGTYTSALQSPPPCTAAVLPISQHAPQPTPTLSGSSPTLTVAISEDVTLDQLFQEIGTPNPVQTVPDTDTSASSAGIPPFQPQAASTQ